MVSQHKNQGAEVETGAFCHRLVVGVFPQSGSPYRQESNKALRTPRVHGDAQEVVSKYNTKPILIELIFLFALHLRV